tara:strand:+ start:849 stop:1220 length:372 start_codon:yes stop_codon:yes gene_type:complete
MNKNINRTDLINLYQSLDLKKPRISKGLKWRSLKVVSIEKFEKDYQVFLQDGHYKDVKSWDTIKMLNKSHVKTNLSHLLNDTLKLTKKDLNFFLDSYKFLSNFYYDGLKTSFLTDTDKSLEAS